MRKQMEITYNGETHTVKEWADIYGVSVDTMRARLKRSSTVEHAFGVDARRSKKRYERYGI